MTAPNWSRCRRVAAIHAHRASVKSVAGGRWPSPGHPGESGWMDGGDEASFIDGFATAGMDGQARVWTLDAASSSGFRCAAAFTDHTAGVRAVAMPPPCRPGRRRDDATSSPGSARTAPDVLAATGSYDRTARLWHASRAAPPIPPLASGHGDYVLCVSFGPDARTLVTGGADGRICVWDCDSGSESTSAPVALIRPGSAVRSVDASLPPPSSHEPNALLSMTGGEDGTLRVFTHAHAGRAACEVVLAGHGGAVTSLALCRGEDRGWSLGLGSRRDGGGVRALRLAAGCDGGILSVHDVAIYDDDGGVEVKVKTSAVFEGRVHASGAARAALLLRPNAKTVASASEDRTVRLWDMQKGSCLCVLVGARCTVESVSFSDLGDLLFAGLADGHAWVYLEEGDTDPQSDPNEPSQSAPERVIESRLALAMGALGTPRDPESSARLESDRCGGGAAPSARRFQDAYEEMEADAIGSLPRVDQSNVGLVGKVAGGSADGGGFGWSERGNPTLECSVCRGELELGVGDVDGDWPAPLPCGHVFHARSCLVPWLRHSTACPLCRANALGSGEPPPAACLPVTRPAG